MKQDISVSRQWPTDMQMGTTPQNIQARLSRKTLKADFIQRVKSIVDACSPLPASIEAAVAGSNINGSNSSNVRQTITADGEALIRENEVLRQQNQFQLWNFNKMNFSHITQFLITVNFF